MMKPFKIATVIPRLCALNEKGHHVKKQQEAKQVRIIFLHHALVETIHELSVTDVYRRIKNILLQKTQNHVFVLF